MLRIHQFEILNNHYPDSWHGKNQPKTNLKQT